MRTAFLETARRCLLQPVTFFRGMTPAGPLAPSLVYAVLVSALAFSVQVVWQVMLPSPWPGLGVGTGEDGSGPLGGMLMILAGLVLLPVVVPLLFLFLAGVYHVVLLLLGGPSRGYVATARAVAYSSSAQLLAIVPVCGSVFALVWGTVLEVIALREAHGIQTGKAVAVVLVPLLLCAVAALAMAALVLGVVGAAAVRGLE
ncbi:MAG: YIP1 family protein [Gemmatimonadota bacterium]